METPFDIDPDLSGYGEIGDVEVIAELTWDGLQKSVRTGQMDEQKALELYYQWFKKRV